MSADIGPGDAVVCIEQPPENDHAPWAFPPSVGSTWIVAVVGEGANYLGQIIPGGAVRLCGDGLPAVTLDGRHPAWPLRCFRKLPPPEGDQFDRRAEKGRTLPPATRPRKPAHASMSLRRFSSASPRR